MKLRDYQLVAVDAEITCWRLSIRRRPIVDEAHHAILAALGITAGIYRRRFCDILRVMGLSPLLLGHAGDALPDEASVLPEEGARLRGVDEAESPSSAPDSA